MATTENRFFEVPSKFAIFGIGERQYVAVEGENLEVERVGGNPGDEVVFDRVLFVKRGDEDYEVGQPVVEGAAVVAEIVEQKRGKKVIVFKRKRRKRYRVKAGHRQPVTVLRVKEIKGV